MWAFCLIAVKKATWVTSSSTGAIWENSAKVLALAGSAQTGTVWSGNTASIWATSTWRTLALLNQTNWSSLNRSFSTSTLCGNNISSLHRKWKFKNYPPPKKSMSGLDAQTREDFLSPEVIFLAVGGAFLNEPRSLGRGSSYPFGETYTDIWGLPWWLSW